MILSRRRLFVAGAALLAAPSIVRVSSLMSAHPWQRLLDNGTFRIFPGWPGQAYAVGDVITLSDVFGMRDATFKVTHVNDLEYAFRAELLA